MKNVMPLFTLLFLIIPCSICFSQVPFIDSGQRLGNSVSWDVKLGDLDGDGDLDAVVANSFWDSVNYQPNQIWINDSDGFFTLSPQQLGSCSGVTIYDLDSDGDPDIIEDAENNVHLTPIKVWLNSGGGKFATSINFPFEGSMICFDRNLNNDDKVRAITFKASGYSTGDSTTIRIYSVNSKTINLDTAVVLINFCAQGISVGDLNNDDYSDIVICKDGPNYILFNDKQGGFTVSEQKLLGTYNTGTITLCDLNGDGYSDILQGNYHHPTTGAIYPVKLYLNDTNGKFNSAPLSYISSYLSYKPITADFDNDGDYDIYMNHGHAFSDYSHKSELLLNDGNAHFTSRIINLENVKSISVAAGDLDNDGDLDVYLACGDADTVVNQDRVWFNTTVTTSIQDQKDKPNNFYLLQNFPNPFNPTTIISYRLSVSGNVKLLIYDLLGQKIKTLVESFQDVGNHSVVWNGTDDSNNPVSSGIYLYRIQSDDMSYQKKMILVR